MTRGPEQTQENHWDIKEGVDEGALQSEAVCKVLFGAQLSRGVLEGSRSDKRQVCVMATSFHGAKMEPSCGLEEEMVKISCSFSGERVNF